MMIYKNCITYSFLNLCFDRNGLCSLFLQCVLLVQGKHSVCNFYFFTQGKCNSSGNKFKDLEAYVTKYYHDSVLAWEGRVTGQGTTELL